MLPLEITDIRMVREEKNSSRNAVIAYVTITLNDQFLIKNIRLIRHSDRLVIGMPNREKIRDCPHCSIRNAQSNRYCHQCGTPLEKVKIDYSAYVDIVHPTKQTFREYLERVIIEEYKRQLGEGINPDSPEA